MHNNEFLVAKLTEWSCIQCVEPKIGSKFGGSKTLVELRIIALFVTAVVKSH